MLTGFKDLDYKILNNLNDKDLINFCSSNSEAKKYCEDQKYWMNRTLFYFSRLGLDSLKNYKKDKSWSDYYIDLTKITNITNGRDSDGHYKTDQAHLGALVIKYMKEERWDYVIILLDRISARRTFVQLWSKDPNFIDTINFLLEKGVNSDIWVLALENAARFGRLDIVKYIVEKAVGEGKIRKKKRRSFIRRYRDEIIEKILKDALIEAAANGQLDIVKYLVEKGVDFNFTDVAKFKPVDYAYRAGEMNVVDYLVFLGAPDPRM